MKLYSVKSFSVVILITIFSSEVLLFFSLYSKAADSLSELLTANIQTKTLNLKHYLNRNISSKDINNIRAYLDSAAHSSKLISDIHIVDDYNNILYSSDLSYKHKHSFTCQKMSYINKKQIFQTQCYTFSIKLYHGLHPYYYKSNIYINQHYLNGLLSKYIQKYILLYTSFTLVFIFFLWLSLKHFIVKPLEELRRYAYYSEKEPKNFLLKELESIRYSLSITFQRLKKEQAELYKLSTQDSLSGLYNRLSLIEKINWLISNNERTHSKFAILFLDLDDFKNINDSMGHNFGDEVLKHISKILLEIVRENDIVSRIGGDEFVIVLPELQNETRVFELADRLIHKLAIPVKTQEYKYQITASVGISLYPRDGEDTDTLLKNADIAMYKSKELGKNKYHFFTSNLNKIVQEKIRMQNLMINGLEHNHFELYYQAKVDIQTNHIVGCEALIRLVDPIEGIISPDKFIPLAEENNFIIPLGKWIIEESTRQIAKWHNTELANLIVSINLSAKQFLDLSLLETLKENTKNIDITKFDIELTESVFASNFENNVAIIHAIKDLGISLSLDDFGTAYSSLSYLKTIPFDTLKIDKSFIDDFVENEQDKSFVLMIINIAKTLNLKVVAEGVERENQRTLLQELQCDIYQGYIYSKPLALKEFEKLVIKHKESPC